MKYLFTFTLILIGILSSNAEKRKVEIVFAQEELVYVVLNETLIGENPSNLKIDFELGGELLFFKRGYYSQRLSLIHI